MQEKIFDKIDNLECSPLIFLNVYLAYKTRRRFKNSILRYFTIYGCENPGGTFVYQKLV